MKNQLKIYQAFFIVTFSNCFQTYFLRRAVVKLECSRCGLCCHNTEMLLSLKDISRLEALGYDRKDFVIITPEGLHQLRNLNGKCFFYREECIVYHSRPEGCVYYPIILDYDGKSCLIDKECPNHYTVSKSEIKDSCKKLKKLYREILKEANEHSK